MMLALTRIFLHNWHRFGHHVIDVADSLYLAGHNGSGKSSVLDAIQLVLVADQGRIRYNSSAQDRSARTLDSYVRGKIGEARYLRPGNTIAYIALEFSAPARDTHVTLGVCVEAAEGRSPERTFYILSEALDPGLLTPDGRALTRRDLRQVLRGRKGARTYDQVGEYQADMLNRLGGLNERFFDLFLRALTFQPIRNIDEFVEQWLLEARPLDVDALQKVVERLGQLRVTAREVEERLAALRRIVDQQAKVRRLRERHAEYTLLATLLQAAVAERGIADLRRRREELDRAMGRAEAACADAEATRTGADAALLEAELRLRQSDVARRKEELERAIVERSREADQTRAVYALLLADLRRAAQELAPLQDRIDGVGEASRALLAAIDALTPERPPPDTFGALLDAAVDAANAALPAAREHQYELSRSLRERRERDVALTGELKRLRADRRLTYAPALERLRDLLTPIAGERPPLLCELLEVPDERWQNAVEAMLGARRFNVIVPPDRFEAALELLDGARAAERIYDVGLLDLGKARDETRPAQPGSLARQVRARAPLIQAYIDTVLGDIITCATPAELRRHRRAVTPEVVVYSEWTARAIPPDRYQPWFIGERAQRSQIESRERELAAVRGEIAGVEPQVAAAAAYVRQLDQLRDLTRLRPRLDAPLDERPLRAEVVGYREELAALDLSGVAALEQEVGRARAVAERERANERSALEERARLRERLPRLEEQQRAAAAALAEHTQRAAEARERSPQAVAAVEGMLAERLAQADLADAIRNAESTARNFDTRAGNELQPLTETAAGYNTRYQFAALAGDPNEERYAAELARLEATELPRYSTQIQEAQAEAEEELREHVLHRLREQIIQARQKLEWINDALARLTFHGERYRFRAQPAEDAREFYDLINDSQLLGSGPLFASDFYQRHRAAFDAFYAQLTRTPQSDAERREQERLVDYRRYLTYDIEITHAGGQTSRLSRIMGQTSGGETQTPFYLTIAASFVQLYHIGERNTRPTIRLVAFDEAFSKMDQDRIGATLDLFQQFGLQIITATPLERCEYLVPKICTSLVLSAVGDGVWIEPYRNYAARLEHYHEDAEVPR
jgi:uncharacterized protein YPO0396